MAQELVTIQAQMERLALESQLDMLTSREARRTASPTGSGLPNPNAAPGPAGGQRQGVKKWDRYGEPEPPGQLVNATA
jgi:hypothetical protein